MNGVEFEPADILIYIREKGLVLKEKSLLAYDETDKKILAFGTEAERMAGEAVENIRVISPLRQGAVADYIAAVRLFECLLDKACGRRVLRKPAVAVCLPEGLSDVEKKAACDVFYQAGAREVMITDIPAECFAGGMQEKFPKSCEKFKVAISITKDDPESYIREQLARVLRYAQREGISAGRVGRLLADIERTGCEKEGYPS